MKSNVIRATHIHDNAAFTHGLSLQQDRNYRVTFLFIAMYYLISHGRIHLVIPALASIPCAMIAGIMAVVAFFFESGQRHDKFYLVREEKLVLGLVLMSLVTLPTSVWPGGSFSAIYKGFIPTVTLMFLTICICRTLEDIKKFVWVYMISCALITFMSLKSDLNHFSKGVTDSYDVNDIAMVLDCSLPLTFYFMLQNRGIKRLLLLVCFFSAITTVILTASRGGVLGLVAFGGYLILNARSRIVSLFVVGLAVVVFIIFAPDGTKERVTSMYNPQTEYDRNLGDRTFIWQSGVKDFFKSPILGVGFGNYAVANGKSDTGLGFKAAHNSLLQISVELGAVGLILFVKLIGGTFVSIRLKRKKMESIIPQSELLWVLKGIEATMIVYTATAFFLSQAYNAQLYFIIALAVAAIKLIDKDSLLLHESPDSKY